MLNAELIETFGDNSKVFFNNFVERVGEGIASLCYAVTNKHIYFGDVVIPRVIRIDTKDTEIVYDTLYSAMNALWYSQHQVGAYNEQDIAPLVVGVDNKSYSGGIQIWVE